MAEHRFQTYMQETIYKFEHGIVDEDSMYGDGDQTPVDDLEAMILDRQWGIILLSI